MIAAAAAAEFGMAPNWRWREPVSERAREVIVMMTMMRRRRRLDVLLYDRQLTRAPLSAYIYGFYRYRANSLLVTHL